MSSKIKFILVIFFLFSLPIGGIIEKQKAGWKGKVEYEEGVKVIKNPREPLYGEIKFELEEDLSIGREDDENYMFYRVRDIAVDNQGNIYVLDMRNFRIQVFDKNGKYLQTMGRQGQGPGEFEQPTIIQINDATGDIYVKDRVTDIDIFSRQGEYIKSIHLQNVIHDFSPLENENILAVISKASESELIYTHALCRINSEGEVINIYAEFPYTLFAKKMIGGTLSVITGHELTIRLARLNHNRFIYGYSKEYELNVIDKDGGVLYRIKKDEPYPKFTSKEKQGFRKIGIPEYKPYFYTLFTDSGGRIYVQRNETRKSEQHVKKIVDIFSKDGYFLYRATLPHNTCVIRNGFLYAYEVDEDKGEELVKRFRIKNWDQIE